MLKNPKIILLDEATSALDSFNESQISEALEVLFEGKTVIIVAHRLQTEKCGCDIFSRKWENSRNRFTRGTHRKKVKIFSDD